MSSTAGATPTTAVLVKQTALVAAGGVVLYAALRLVRARVYDALIVRLTTEWYEHVLRRLPSGAKFLDVGIGTGLALVQNQPLLRAKSISVEGVDYDADYVERCRALVRSRHLTDAVRVHHASIYDFSGGPYDAVYFSASLMIMPDPVAALRHAKTMLHGPNARIYVTQTIQTRRSRLVELGKPLLKFLTTIDFGQVTYEADLLATFQAAGLTVLENVPISGSTRTSTRSFRLFVLQP